MKLNKLLPISAYAIVLCVFALIGQGCTVAVREGDGAAIKIEEASLAKVEAWEFGDLYEAVRIVPLETTPQALFAKLEQTIVTDSLIFVRAEFSADAIDAAVWQYDSNGKFLRQIGAVGQGPGEYHTVRHMALRNDTLFLFDNWNQNVHLYDAISGKHIHSSPTDGFQPLTGLNTALPIPGSANFLISSDVHFGDSTYALAECNPMTDYFNKILPQKHKVDGWISYTFAYPSISSFTRECALALLPMDDKIYSIEYKTGEVRPFARLCVGAPAPESSDGDSYETVCDIAEEQKFNRLTMLYASEDYLIVNQRFGSVIWNLKSQKGWHTPNRWKQIEENTFPFIPMLLTEAQPDNTFVCAFDAEDFKDYTHSPSNPLITLANGDQAIDPDGNSILVIYKLK